MDALLEESREETPPTPAEAAGAALAAEPGNGTRARNALSALRLFGLLLALVLLSKFFVVVPAGERGVLLRFGAVQDHVLQEGLHPLLPVMYSVRPISVRVRSLAMRSEAASRDLQDVQFDVAVSWHIRSDRVGRLYERLGDDAAVVGTVIEPAVEDGLKAVVAHFTAEQLITERDAVKKGLADLLAARLDIHDLDLDAVDLLQVEFSPRFRQAVEAKQVAEQDARRAEFEAVKAQRLAAARVYRARGEAQAQQLLQAGLTPEILQHEAIERWNGHLPLVVGSESLRQLDLGALRKADRKQDRGKG